MNKAKELLKELQNLDMDIQSRIDEINELEAGLLSSPKWIDVKVQGGQARKVDDVYTQLVVMKEAISSTFSQLSNNMTTLQSFTSEFQKYSDTRRKEQKYI